MFTRFSISLLTSPAQYGSSLSLAYSGQGQLRLYHPRWWLLLLQYIIIYYCIFMCLPQTLKSDEQGICLSIWAYARARNHRFISNPDDKWCRCIVTKDKAPCIHICHTASKRDVYIHIISVWSLIHTANNNKRMYRYSKLQRWQNRELSWRARWALSAPITSNRQRIAGTRHAVPINWSSVTRTKFPMTFVEAIINAVRVGRWPGEVIMMVGGSLRECDHVCK